MYTFALKNGQRPHSNPTVPSRPKTVTHTGSIRVIFDESDLPVCRVFHLPPTPNAKFLSRAQTARATRRRTRVASEWKRGGSTSAGAAGSARHVSMGSVEGRPEQTATRVQYDCKTFMGVAAVLTIY